ncbi:27583_t:CDS:2, partial [Racocetra persica]
YQDELAIYKSSQQQEFSDDFYASETQLNRLTSSSSSTMPRQTTLPVLFLLAPENVQINIDLVTAFAEADILLEK